MSSQKIAEANRSHGGPGSSQQNARKPLAEAHTGSMAGEPTSGPKSKVSGGGGERDSHHTHASKAKGGHPEN